MQQLYHFSGDTESDNCNSGISAQGTDFPAGVESPPEQQGSPRKDTAVQTGTEPTPELLWDPVCETEPNHWHSQGMKLERNTCTDTVMLVCRSVPLHSCIYSSK